MKYVASIFPSLIIGIVGSLVSFTLVQSFSLHLIAGITVAFLVGVCIAFAVNVFFPVISKNLKQDTFMIILAAILTWVFMGILFSYF